MKKLILLAIVIFFTVSQALAQGCAMCKSSAANLNEDSARGLNSGILYLVAFPLLLMGGTAYYWYRKNKLAESEQVG